MVEANLKGTEKYREYQYTDGFTYRVEAPVTLWIKTKPEGDSHRVLDASGITHYIPAGWRVLRWSGRTEF